MYYTDGVEIYKVERLDWIKGKAKAFLRGLIYKENLVREIIGSTIPGLEIIEYDNNVEEYIRRHNGNNSRADH